MSQRVVLDPTSERAVALRPRRPRIATLDGVTVGLLDISKPRGEGIVCRSGREEALRGRKFVVAGGEALECEAPASRTGYRVYRSGARGGGPVESAGEVAPGGARR